MTEEMSQPDREANVGFASELLATEISQRNAQKAAQESTGRWIVLTVVALMTLLLTLSKEAGILNAGTSWPLRVAFIATLVAAGATVACAGGVLWPRVYERLGGDGLDRFNKSDFLDLPTHEVTGQVVATQIGIVKTMDKLHEQKAKWLKRSFAGLAATLIFVVAQGVILGVDPPPSGHPEEAKISPWIPARTSQPLNCEAPPARSQVPPHISRCRPIR
jgi:hypothetical protein